MSALSTAFFTVAGHTFDPRRCVSHHPGHTHHHVQIGLALAASWVPVAFKKVRGSSATFSTESGEFTGWNHDAARLVELFTLSQESAHPNVDWCASYRLIRVVYGQRAGYIYLSDGPVTECRFLQ